MEIFKEVIGYEGLYQVSNLGNVISLKYGKLRKLKPCPNGSGYLHVILSKDGFLKTRTVHQLVAECFLDYIPCGHKLVINHKDFDRKNNKLENLEIITQRQNTSQEQFKSTSEYVGVNWNKKGSKWEARIWIKGKRKSLGFFLNEIEAHNAYQKQLNEI